MALDEWWKQRRAEANRQAMKTITGVDPATQRPLMDAHDVQMQIGTMVRQLFDGGADPIHLVQCYLMGAVWLADNVGISREQLAKAIHAVESKRDFIFKPGM